MKLLSNALTHVWPWSRIKELEQGVALLKGDRNNCIEQWRRSQAEVQSLTSQVCQLENLLARKLPPMFERAIKDLVTTAHADIAIQVAKATRAAAEDGHDTVTFKYPLELLARAHPHDVAHDIVRTWARDRRRSSSPVHVNTGLGNPSALANGEASLTVSIRVEDLNYRFAIAHDLNLAAPDVADCETTEGKQ